MQTIQYFGKTIEVNTALKESIFEYVAYASLNWIQASVFDPKRNIVSDIEGSLRNALLEAYVADMGDITNDQWDELSESLEEQWYDKGDAALIEDFMSLFR